MSGEALHKHPNLKMFFTRIDQAVAAQVFKARNEYVIVISVTTENKMTDDVAA